MNWLIGVFTCIYTLWLINSIIEYVILVTFLFSFYSFPIENLELLFYDYSNCHWLVFSKTNSWQWVIFHKTNRHFIKIESKIRNYFIFFLFAINLILLILFWFLFLTYIPIRFPEIWIRSDLDSTDFESEFSVDH